MLIIGLWNSHIELNNTVHNIGQLTLKAMLKDLDTTFINKVVKKDYKKSIGKYKLYTYLLKNNIYLHFLLLEGSINSTGENLKYAGEEIDKIMSKNEIITIYDDLGLSTGKVLVSYGKGSSRHNGALGIDENISEKHWKIRIGMTKDEETSYKTFVLSLIKSKDEVNKVMFNLSFSFLDSIIKHTDKSEKIIMNSVQTKINTEFK